VRDILARKACGSLFGLWLLIAEFRILGTWERLVRWTRKPHDAVEPRLALQLVNEAALCSTGIRARQRMCNKGFELANGLPWVATDTAIHDLLDSHSGHDACAYQVELGRIRRACGHLPLRLVAIDPHRVRSSTIRRMVKAVPSPGTPPTSVANLFFALDAESKQPVAFTLHTSDQTTSQATPGLVQLIHDIAPDAFIRTVADAEHCTHSIVSHFAADPNASLLTPLPITKAMLRFCRAIPDTDFVHVCAGFAYATAFYSSHVFDSLRVLVQRIGMHPDDFSLSHLPSPTIPATAPSPYWSATFPTVGISRSSSATMAISPGIAQPPTTSTSVSTTWLSRSMPRPLFTSSASVSLLPSVPGPLRPLPTTFSPLSTAMSVSAAILSLLPSTTLLLIPRLPISTDTSPPLWNAST
jgi:hypothetical protein